LYISFMAEPIVMNPR